MLQDTARAFAHDALPLALSYIERLVSINFEDIQEASIIFFLLLWRYGGEYDSSDLLGNI